jgi:hypothetical protein
MASLIALSCKVQQELEQQASMHSASIILDCIHLKISTSPVLPKTQHRYSKPAANYIIGQEIYNLVFTSIHTAVSFLQRKLQCLTCANECNQ